MKTIKVSLFLVGFTLFGFAGYTKSSRYYSVPPAASVQIRGTVVKIANRSHRLVYVYAVDNWEVVDYSNNRPLKIEPGPRKLGIFVMDRAGRMNGNFNFSAVTGHKYRIEADRHPSLVDESLTKIFLSAPRKGLVELPSAEASLYTYRLKFIDETDGHDVTVAEIPAKMTDDPVPLPDEKPAAKKKSDE